MRLRIRDDMSLKEKNEYIFTYYMWYILGICAAVGLAIFLIVHFAFPQEKEVFSSAMINQGIDYDRDKEL